MLELRNVSAGYGGAPVLHDVTFTFPPGRVVALVGPNGSGKSTLLKTAVGLLKRTAGEILLDGMPLGSLPPKVFSRRVAYLPQLRAVPELTVWRMVLHGRFPHLGWPRRVRDTDREIAWNALAAVGMEEYAHRLLRELSGGQRQKVYLAMTLAQESDTVLMDEPIAWLDIENQLQTMETARRLAAEGKAVAMVLHDLPLALQSADEVAVLRAGRIVRAGTPEEIYESGVVPETFRVGLRRTRTDAGSRYFCEPL